MYSPIRRIGALALVVLTLAACSADQVAAPTQMKAAPSEPDASLLGGLLGTVTGVLNLTTNQPVQRTKPLAAPITVTKEIGYYGGTLSIPEAGVTVIVPRGALMRTTTITMTARAGSLLAYDFSPTGTTFYKPLLFNQTLRGTNVTLLQVPLLRLGYYSDPGLLGQVTAVVSDLLGGVTNLLDWSFNAPIKHFSGYVVVCGRSSDGE
jgi:hypothetical protein